MATAMDVSHAHLGEAAPQSGDVTGIIRPPPDIRAIVDKTALFVARNGKSFEARIQASAEGQSNKFAFMRPSDPYNAYYEFKIREVEENGGELKPDAPAAPPPPETTSVSAAATTVTKRATMATPVARALQGVDASAAPPAPLSSAPATPTSLGALDAEIIKLTAQYTAASGRQFLAGLAQREQRNPQFDFLKPTHVLFSYFTALVDAYTKVLAPTRELTAEINAVRDRSHALSRVARRWDYSRRADEQARRDKAELAAERSAYQAVDWHDFVVVEVIDFPRDELVGQVVPPPPPPPRLADMQVDELPPGFGSGAPPPPPPPPPAALPRDDDIEIVDGYVPRVASGARDGPTTMIDPLTGNEVPIDRMTEHMKIQLLDPKWRDEQKKLAARGDTTRHLAQGEQIASSLSAFAKQRNDIFGSTEDEEAALLEKDAAKAQGGDGRIIWDGHGSSVDRVQARVLDILAEQAPGGAAAADAAPSYAAPLVGALRGLDRGRTRPLSTSSS